MLLDKFKETFIKLDTPSPWGIFFQDSATPQMEGLEELHNNIMFYLAIILFTVTWMMITIIKNFISSKSLISHKYMNHGKFVPFQKCSKLNNIFLKKKIYIRTYTTLPSNPIDNNCNNHVKIYEDSYKMRKDIFKENKGKSGIYMLTNKLTSDIYIGQSGDISKRFKNYFNFSYIKSKDSFLISKALIKYGYTNFSVTILEYCDKSDLLVREQYYFNKLNPQYNILKIAKNSLNFKHSEETKKLMSLKKAKDNNLLSEKTHSKGTINLIKQKVLGRIHYENTNMSAIRGNPVNIYEKCTSKGFKLIGSFISARRAGKFLDISGNTIIKYKNSGEIYKDRYKFSSK